MRQAKPPPEGPAKGAENAADTPKTLEPFRRLTKRLLKVPRESLVEQERIYRDSRGSGGRE